MHLTFDCDEVILNTGKHMRKYYLRKYPNAQIPFGTYPSSWAVFGKDIDERKKNWLQFNYEFKMSDAFMKISVVPGAIRWIHELILDGHTIDVISAISDDKNVMARRKEQLEHAAGQGIFNKIICINQMGSKTDKLKETGSDLMMDDSPANISGAVELGLYALFFRCAENSAVIDAIQNPDDDIAQQKAAASQSFWKWDYEKLRKDAIIVSDWWHAYRVIRQINRDRLHKFHPVSR